MASEKPGFYIWFERVDTMKELSLEEKGMMFEAAVVYARKGEEPVFGDRLLRSIWTALKIDLDKDNRNYQQRSEENTIKGYRRAFKTYALQHGLDPTDERLFNAYVQNQLEKSKTLSQPQLATASSSKPVLANNNPNNNLSKDVENVKDVNDVCMWERKNGNPEEKTTQPVSEPEKQDEPDLSAIYSRYPDNCHESVNRAYQQYRRQGYTHEAAIRKLTPQVDSLHTDAGKGGH